ncbi:MAG: restriction endonuclease subunit S [Bacteroidales bacterium]|nr:restriction endonuclease subunit S [Bacteroidales bacterium]
MNKPKIRIKGFEGEWEEKLLSNIATITMGQSPSSLFYNDCKNGLPLIQGNADIKDRKSIIRYYTSQITKTCDVGDILMSVRAPVGAVGIACNYSCIGRGVCGIKTEEPLLFQCLIAKENKWDYLSAGSTFSSINSNILKNVVLRLPPFQEQQSLASFFRSFDSLIHSTAKKIASLKQIKAASLQSMFPQNGETKPKVRFKGFEEEWETCELKDISVKITEKNKNNEINITLTNSAEYGIINQRDFFDHDISNKNNISGYYVVKNEDFVYNPRISTSAPVGPINMNQLGYSGVMSPLYYVFRVDGIDKEYLNYFFKTKYWHKFMKDNGNTGARFDRLSISDDIFAQMPIPHPSSLSEQQKIASYFRSLDEQISLQEKRLEKLKQIKSTCLDKMFV